jgi:hypothetical protein
MSSTKPTNIPPSSYRIPPELKHALAARAECNKRSVSQELVAAIEYYLTHAPLRFAHLLPMVAMATNMPPHVAAKMAATKPPKPKK